MNKKIYHKYVIYAFAYMKLIKNLALTLIKTLIIMCVCVCVCSVNLYIYICIYVYMYICIYIV